MTYGSSLSLCSTQPKDLKTLSYYIMHMSVAMLVGYCVTGSLIMAITLSLLEPTVQAIAFFFHEKVWDKQAITTMQPQESSV